MQPFGIPYSTSSTGLAAYSRRRGGEALLEPAGECDRSPPRRRGAAQGHDSHSAGDGPSSSVRAAVAAARSASAEAVEQAKGSVALRMVCRSPCVLGSFPEFETPGSSASELLSKSLHAFEPVFTPSPIARSAASGLRDNADLSHSAIGASSDAGPRMAAFEDAVPVAPNLAGMQATSAQQLVIAPALAGPGAQHTGADSNFPTSRGTPAKTLRRPCRRRPSMDEYPPLESTPSSRRSRFAEKTSAQGSAPHGVQRRAVSCDDSMSAERRPCISRTPSKKSARARSQWPESAGAYERLDGMEAELLGPLGGPCGRGTGLMRLTLPDTPMQGQPLPTAATATPSTGPAGGSTARGPQRRSLRRSHRGSHSSKCSRRSLRHDAVPEATMGLVDTMHEGLHEELWRHTALRDNEIEKLRFQLAAVEGDKEREFKTGRLLRKQLELLRQAPVDDSACVPAQRDKHSNRKKGLENELQEVRRQLFSVKEDLESAARREIEAERARCEALSEQMAALQHERQKALQLLRAVVDSTADDDNFEVSVDTELEEGSELIQELLKARDFHKAQIERVLSERTAVAAESDNARSDHESFQRRHDALVRKLQDEQSVTEALQTELQAERDMMEVLRAQLSTERSERFAEKQSQRQRLDEDLQRWKKEEETLMNERDAATKASLDAQGNLESLQKSFTSLKADHEQALNNETHLKSKLRQQEEKEQRTRADLANERRELQATAQGLQDELARERQAKEDLQAREQPLRDNVESERKAKEDLEWRLQQVQQEAEVADQMAEAAMQELEAACLERSTRIKELQSELEQCRMNGDERVLALQFELENAKRSAKVLKTQCDRAQYDLEEAERERDQLRDDSRDLKRKKMIELSKALDDEREVTTQLKKTNQELQHANLALRDQLSGQPGVSPGRTSAVQSGLSETEAPRSSTTRPAVHWSAAGLQVSAQEEEDEEEEVKSEDVRASQRDRVATEPVTSSVRWIVSTPTTASPWDTSPSPMSRSQARAPRSFSFEQQGGAVEDQEDLKKAILRSKTAPIIGGQESMPDAGVQAGRGWAERSTDPFLSARSSLVDQGVSIEGLLDDAEFESH